MAERGDQTDLDQQNEMRQHSSFGRHIVKGMPFISHQPETTEDISISGRADKFSFYLMIKDSKITGAYSDGKESGFAAWNVPNPWYGCQ